MKWFNAAASDTQVTHGRRIWLYLFSIAVMVFMVAPTLIVIPMSFSASTYLEFPPRDWSIRWYEAYFTMTVWPISNFAIPRAMPCPNLMSCHSASVGWRRVSTPFSGSSGLR